MEALLTVLAFVTVTALLALDHLRRSRAGAPRTSSRPCPRCRAAVPEGISACGACGAPLQAFELVTARVAAAETKAAEGPLHAVVRGDVCVGCGACVPVCPEPGAILLVDKLARVDPGLCKGHAQCVAACPVGAIFVTSGDAVQTVEVPELNAHFETNVPGLYVVGELGGRGLIKNAINEGKIAVEHVARRTAAERAGRRGNDGVLDVPIVGSGPAGLSAGLEAVRSGLRYVVLEQGTLSDTIARYPREKLLLAEPTRVQLYGDLWVADASKEELLQVWRNVIEKTRLQVLTGKRLESVVRDGDVFQVRAGDAEFRARRVVLAMGRRGTPRKLGVPGEELSKVFYDIVEMEAFAGRRMLVVGGGDSAVESALGLSAQAGTTVTLSYRGTEFSRIKERNRVKLEAAAKRGLEVLLASEVREIRRDVVALEHRGTLRVLPNDVVIVRIGGDAPYPFLKSLGVRIVRKEIPVATGAAAAG